MQIERSTSKLISILAVNMNESKNSRTPSITSSSAFSTTRVTSVPASIWPPNLQTVAISTKLRSTSSTASNSIQQVYQLTLGLARFCTNLVIHKSP